ncbi:MAG: hypothetical protein ACRD0J_01780, partial [Acidimicrobiales bacterium]
SDRVGPMAWGSQGMVFLGEDLMHSRDYSEDTSRVIDEEVERILREQEERATEYLSRHRAGLDAVVAEVIERETLSGEEVGRLVDQAFGRPVHGESERPLPHRFSAALEPGSPGNGSTHGDDRVGAGAGSANGHEATADGNAVAELGHDRHRND